MKYSTYAQIVAIFSAAATIIGLFLWAGLLPHSSQNIEVNIISRLVLSAIFAIPLIFSIRGLYKSRTYTAGWTSMLSAIYASFALASYMTDPPSIGLWITLIASAVLFASSTLYPRLCSREQVT